jgi:hypothetical protein
MTLDEYTLNGVNGKDFAVDDQTFWDIGLLQYIYYDYASDFDIGAPHNWFYGRTFEEVRDNFVDMLERHELQKYIDLVFDAEGIDYHEIDEIFNEIVKDLEVV